MHYPFSDRSTREYFTANDAVALVSVNGRIARTNQLKDQLETN